MLNQIDDLLGVVDPDRARLAQLKLSVEEKLETIKQLDAGCNLFKKGTGHPLLDAGLADMKSIK
jgi:hypothetical protein